MQNPDDAAGAGRGSFVGRLYRRHTRLVVVSAVVGLLAGLVVYVVSPNSYTAESRLLVGSFEAPSAAIPGYVLASQTVAANYARLATSTTVRDKLAEDLGVPADDAARNITVTAIPESAVIRVTATGDSADDARRSAEAMADALDATVQELNAGSSGDALLDQYRAASEALSAARNGESAAGAALATAQAANPEGGQAVLDAQAALAEAQLEVATAQLRVDGLATQYQIQQEAVSTSSRMRVLGGAQVSEDSSWLSLGSDALVGLALGTVAGFALAWNRDRRAGSAPLAEEEPLDDDALDEAPVGAKR